MAEERIQGGSKQYQNRFAKESLNREQIQMAQSKIEMGFRRKVNLEKETGNLDENEKNKCSGSQSPEKVTPPRL